jgi:hypothetical protein
MFALLLCPLRSDLTRNDTPGTTQYSIAVQEVLWQAQGGIALARVTAHSPPAQPQQVGAGYAGRAEGRTQMVTVIARFMLPSLTAAHLRSTSSARIHPRAPREAAL